MPKSKRNKLYSLSSTKRKGTEGKASLIQEVRDCCDQYEHVFVFSVENMRNNKLKEVRAHWKTSRFFFGKNRVMQLALGRSGAEEFKDGLHLVSKELHGNRGLLFTNTKCDEVTKWFTSYCEEDYARSGCVATQDIILKEGPLEQFPHYLEPQLRALGLPTIMERGRVMLVKEHVVCHDGSTLTPEQSRLVKLLGIKMAEFKVVLLSRWSKNDGVFQLLQDVTHVRTVDD